MVLLRIVLFIIFLYLIFQLIFRFLFGFGRKRSFFFKSDDHQYSHQKHDGQITVNRSTSKKGKKISKDEGEYVKFEEIKDEK